MKTLITGSQGRLGIRLMRGIPGVFGLDRIQGADIQADLETVDYEKDPMKSLLPELDAVIHLATSPDPDDPPAVHFQAVSDAARLFQACAAAKVPRLVVASSKWAKPEAEGLLINCYGHSKRVIEAMVEMYDNLPGLKATAVRVGWVPADRAAMKDAPAWLVDDYWSDERLVAEFRKALET